MIGGHYGPECDGSEQRRPLRIQAFKVADQQRPKVTPGRRRTDSSPAFVQNAAGDLLVAGLNNFVIMFRSHSYNSPLQPRFSTFGEGGGGLVVPPQAAWIDSITGAAAIASNPMFEVDDSDASSAVIRELRETDDDIYPIVQPGRRPR